MKDEFCNISNVMRTEQAAPAAVTAGWGGEFRGSFIQDHESLYCGFGLIFRTVTLLVE